MLGELPLPDIVIGAEVFLCMSGPVFEAGQSLSVRNAITKLELSVGLSKVRSALGAYVWEVEECSLVGE